MTESVRSDDDSCHGARIADSMNRIDSWRPRTPASRGESGTSSGRPGSDDDGGRYRSGHAWSVCPRRSAPRDVVARAPGAGRRRSSPRARVALHRWRSGAHVTHRTVDAFGRALEIFAETGASWDARRIRGRLRSLGVRRRLVAAQRPRSGWESITDSEQHLSKARHQLESRARPYGEPPRTRHT